MDNAPEPQGCGGRKQPHGPEHGAHRNHSIVKSKPHFDKGVPSNTDVDAMVAVKTACTRMSMVVKGIVVLVLESLHYIRQ